MKTLRRLGWHFRDFCSDLWLSVKYFLGGILAVVAFVGIERWFR